MHIFRLTLLLSLPPLHEIQETGKIGSNDNADYLPHLLHVFNLYDYKNALGKDLRNQCVFLCNKDQIADGAVNS